MKKESLRRFLPAESQMHWMRPPSIAIFGKLEKLGKLESFVRLCVFFEFAMLHVLALFSVFGLPSLFYRKQIASYFHFSWTLK